MDFDWWFSGAQCSRHSGTGASVVCARCGSFCCPDCVDFAEPGHCRPCGLVLVRARRATQARRIAMKLALSPAIAVVAGLVFAARLKGVPWLFAIWLVPLGCAVALARTERPGIAWLGVVATLGISFWFAAGLVWLEHWSPLLDLAFLAAPACFAVPGCRKLSQTVAELRLAESGALP